VGDQGLVTAEKVQLRLNTMVFFIKEVELGCKFFNDFLVLVLVVLHRKLVVVLTALVELAEA
jgi:hypothetical protein